MGQTAGPGWDPHPVGTSFAYKAIVVGRITEEHLTDAEASFPGIGEMYRGMVDKPMTFLQLVWKYETQAAAAVRRPRRSLRPTPRVISRRFA